MTKCECGHFLDAHESHDSIDEYVKYRGHCHYCACGQFKIEKHPIILRGDSK